MEYKGSPIARKHTREVDLAQAHMALPDSDYSIRQLWSLQESVFWQRFDKNLSKSRHPDIPEKWDLAQAHMALPGSGYTIRQLWNA
jgi:hypothetical protein